MIEMVRLGDPRTGSQIGLFQDSKSTSNLSIIIIQLSFNIIIVGIVNSVSSGPFFSAFPPTLPRRDREGERMDMPGRSLSREVQVFYGYNLWPCQGPLELPPTQILLMTSITSLQGKQFRVFRPLGLNLQTPILAQVTKE